ncbi:hypothetical protein J6590_061058 [Homalodisca vitripennis]|nr:hypothetical protein J6590_061058 [Homalodisca vitripennis]
MHWRIMNHDMTRHDLTPTVVSARYKSAESRAERQVNRTGPRHAPCAHLEFRMYCVLKEQRCTAIQRQAFEKSEAGYAVMRVRANNPCLKLNMETNGLKVTSEPPPMTGQTDFLQGQDHPSSCHAPSFKGEKGNYCYKLEFKDPRLSFTQTGDQPDLDPSSSPGARHIGPGHYRGGGGVLRKGHIYRVTTALTIELFSAHSVILSANSSVSSQPQHLQRSDHNHRTVESRHLTQPSCYSNSGERRPQFKQKLAYCQLFSPHSVILSANSSAPSQPQHLQHSDHNHRTVESRHLTQPSCYSNTGERRPQLKQKLAYCQLFSAHSVILSANSSDSSQPQHLQRSDHNHRTVESRILHSRVAIVTAGSGVHS